MLRTLLLSSAIALALTACGDRTAPESTMPASDTATAAPTENALFTASTLPFQAPPFDKLKDADYQPAIEEGMKQHLAEIRTIADNTEAPTFENTIEAMERSGELLTRSINVFFMLTGANTNETLQGVEEALAPKLAEHSDAIYLDPALFARVKTLYDQRETLGLDAEQRTVLEHTHDGFVRAGALLNEADKAELRKLNAESSTLSTAFGNKLLAANNAGGVFVTDVAELDGLDEGAIAAAADAAKAAGKDGQWLLSLQNTTQQPVLASLKNRALRERVLAASTGRTEQGDANDTRATIQRLAELRARQAQLLGFPNYAAYSIADQMAKTPEAALKLLTDTVPAATARARAELAKIQGVVDAQNGGFTAGAADWDFYAEQVRKAEFDLDESQIKPYF
ncbi:MAG: M3 family metallopeptidase, partial [Luteimonas sp.]